MHRFPKLRQSNSNSSPPPYTEDFENWRQNASNQCRLTHGKLYKTLSSHLPQVAVGHNSCHGGPFSSSNRTNKMLFTDPSKMLLLPTQEPWFPHHHADSLHTILEAHCAHPIWLQTVTASAVFMLASEFFFVSSECAIVVQRVLSLLSNCNCLLGLLFPGLLFSIVHP